jgi:formylglycine-generating enzyme required for sulfatase activity
MKIHPVLRAIVLGLTLTVAALHAQVPQILNYSSRITVGSPAQNFSGTGAFKFALVNATCGSCYWSNDGTSVAGSEPRAAVSLAVSDGLYSVRLGDTTLPNMAPLPDTVFAQADMRLRVWFDDGANGFRLLQPDERLAVVAHAMVVGSLHAGHGAELSVSAVRGSGVWLTDAAKRQIAPQSSFYLSNRLRLKRKPVRIDDSAGFKFALVNAAGDTCYWSNDGSSEAGSEPIMSVRLPLHQGRFSVLLGDTTLTNMTPIPSSVFANSDVHLRVWFDHGMHGFQRLQPDPHLAVTGYGIVADTLQRSADIASGKVTAFSDHGVWLSNVPDIALAAALPSAVPAGVVHIPAGAFQMGDQSGDGLTNAETVTVELAEFYMDATEVTLGQWQAVQQWGALRGYYTDLPLGVGNGLNHPVQMVSWYDCVKWCNARSELAGLPPVYYSDVARKMVYRTGIVERVQVDWEANGYRLPTEAEWEKAARGGLIAKRFPWGNQISQKLGNYYGAISIYDFGPNGVHPIGRMTGWSPATTPVASFAANGYGLHDMAGNVFEWCWDRYGTPYAGGSDPHGLDVGAARVLRGGSWSSRAAYARCAAREYYAPVIASRNLGFRTVLSAVPAPELLRRETELLGHRASAAASLPPVWP